MKHYVALSLLVGAFAVALFSLFGDDSYSRLQSLRRSIEHQQLKNTELEGRVTKLQSEISSIRFDDKKLETTVRNELGMARPNELIFRFDSTLDEEAKKVEAERLKAGANGVQARENASVLRSAALPLDSSQSAVLPSSVLSTSGKSTP